MKLIFSVILITCVLQMPVNAIDYEYYEKYLSYQSDTILSKGTLSLDFTPDWEWSDDKTHTLVDLGGFQIFKWYKSSTDQNILIFKYKDENGVSIQAGLRTTGDDNDILKDGTPWKGKTHRIKVAWDLDSDDQFIELSVDDKIKDKELNTWNGTYSLSDPIVGSGYYGDANGVISNLQVSDIITDSIDPSFHARVDDAQSIVNNNGQVFGGASQFVNGVEGNGLLISQGQKLRYLATLLGEENDNEKGSISFYFKPSWQWNDGKGHQLIDFGDGAIQIFKWFKASESENILTAKLLHDSGAVKTEVSIRTDGSGNSDIFGDGSSWKNKWHCISVAWDATAAIPYIILNLDNKVSNALPFSGAGVKGTGTNLNVGYGHWPSADGAFDEIRVFNVPTWDDDNPIESFVQMKRHNGIWDNHETVQVSIDAPILADNIAQGEPHFFYKTPDFERVFEGTLPLNQNQVATTLEASIAKGEYETVFINVFSRINKEDVVFKIGDLQSAEGNTVSNVKLHVVKNWWQAGVGARRQLFPEYVPELLLSSDIDGDARYLQTDEWAPTSLPSLPKAHQSVHTNLIANTSKQLAIVIEVPNNVTAGTYSTYLNLDQGLGGTLASIPVVIQVEPFSLLDSRRRYITYHTASRDEISPDHYYVSENIYRQQLDDLVAHGMNGLINYEPVTSSSLGAMVEQSREAGIEMIIAIRHSMSTRPNIIAEFNQHGFEPWFYGLDEPNKPYEIDDHINISDNIHKDGGLVFTAISHEYDMRLRTDPCCDGNDDGSVYYDPNTPEIDIDDDVSTRQSLDLANILLEGKGATSYFDSLVDGQGGYVPDQTYYWQSMQENPLLNRSYSGYYLWNTGMSGVSPYVYSDVRNNPYDDWDVWSNGEPAYRDHLTSYPSIEGPVTTMQWEAFREGVDDLRYLNTWKNYHLQFSALEQLVLKPDFISYPMPLPDEDPLPVSDPVPPPEGILAAAVADTFESYVNDLLVKYKYGFTGISIPGSISAQSFTDDRAIIKSHIRFMASHLPLHSQHHEKNFLVVQAEDGVSVDLNGNGARWISEPDNSYVSGSGPYGEVLRAASNGFYDNGGESDVFYNLQFNDTEYDTYYLYARVRNVSSGNQDSLNKVTLNEDEQLDSLDYAEESVWLGSGLISYLGESIDINGKYHWSLIGKYNVNPGATHTLRLGIREKDTRIDTLVFHPLPNLDMDNSAFLDALVGTGISEIQTQDTVDDNYLAFEAESGSVVDLNNNGSTWVVESDNSFVSGKPPTGNVLVANTKGFYDSGGESDVIYNVRFTNWNNPYYHLYVRTRNEEVYSSSDSIVKAMRFEQDGLNTLGYADHAVHLSDQNHIGEYHWKKVGSYYVTPDKLYSLRIGIREKKTRLDSFVFHIADDLDIVNPNVLDDIIKNHNAE